jgi:OOP family OmpA-OmpF porin
MTKKTLMLMAILALIATPAAAERGQKGDWELGGYGGIGMPDSYDPDSGAELNPGDGWLYGARFGYFITQNWSAEGSLQSFNTKTDYPSSAGLSNDEINIDSYRANALYNFRPGQMFRPFITAGLGREKTGGGSPASSSDLGFNAGGGARWYFGKYFGLRLDGKLVRINYEDDFPDQNNLEATVGALWSFGGAAAGPPPDADGDGVPDKKDKCPNTPAGARVDVQGCPVDTDGDGVPDGIDACPNSPKGSKVDATGCPPDADKDGVTDDKDACPNTPQGTPVDEKGCPRDSDGDGVPDPQDRCPDTPAGTKVDASGCPPPEPAPAPPPELPAEVARVFNGILEGVNFASNSSKLTAASLEDLDEVAKTLQEWPDVKVEVGGHTDSQASDAFNMKLSQARAESVMKYLVSKGVDPSRLTAKGYGETRPLADNGTADGRAKNRRVELNQIK